MTDHSLQLAIETERPVALTSADHLYPHGTRHDNSRNPRFNQKLYALYPPHREIAILDLGCAGGGFVRDCLNDGHLAVGIEGSDYSKLRHRAEWATIPEYLFTADITTPFSLTNHGQPMLFDVVTAWEVMEHIEQNEIVNVVGNVLRHLKPGGLWIMSISPTSERIGKHQLHRTIASHGWWNDRLEAAGFYSLDELVDYFGTQFVRGPKYGAWASFHLVVTNDPSEAPRAPSLSLKNRVKDRWYGSSWQRLIQHFVEGE